MIPGTREELIQEKNPIHVVPYLGWIHMLPHLPRKTIHTIQLTTELNFVKEEHLCGSVIKYASEALLAERVLPVGEITMRPYFSLYY